MPRDAGRAGQLGNICSGGGTLVARSSLIAVAGFARVPVLGLARRCFLPVMCGLAVAAVFAVIVLGWSWPLGGDHARGRVPTPVPGATHTRRAPLTSC